MAMHAIGLTHEFNRYDRDRYIKPIFRNIKRGRKIIHHLRKVSFTYHMVMNFVQGMISNFLLNPGFSGFFQVPYNYYSV